LLAEIHAQYADGQLIKSIPVFRALYKAVGLVISTNWLASIACVICSGLSAIRATSSKTGQITWPRKGLSVLF